MRVRNITVGSFKVKIKYFTSYKTTKSRWARQMLNLVLDFFNKIIMYFVNNCWQKKKVFQIKIAWRFAVFLWFCSYLDDKKKNFKEYFWNKYIREEITQQNDLLIWKGGYSRN